MTKQPNDNIKMMQLDSDNDDAILFIVAVWYFYQGISFMTSNYIPLSNIIVN